MRGYSLVLETPLALATTLGVEPVLLANVTHEAGDWKRSIRAQGGFWQGTFSLPLTPMSVDGFNKWLGAHVTERSGGAVSWEGMVYELELNQNGLSRRRSLDSTRNRVRVDWTDLSDVAQSTAWATNDDSIDTFGQKEEILDSDGHIDTEVEKARDIYVARYGWPWGEPLVVNPHAYGAKLCPNVVYVDKGCVGKGCKPCGEVGDKLRERLKVPAQRACRAKPCRAWSQGG